MPTINYCIGATVVSRELGLPHVIVLTILRLMDQRRDKLALSDMPHDTDYPYPIRILVGFLSDTAVLHFDTDFNKIYGDIIFNYIMYASQNYSTME